MGFVDRLLAFRAVVLGYHVVPFAAGLQFLAEDLFHGFLVLRPRFDDGVPNCLVEGEPRWHFIAD